MLSWVTLAGDIKRLRNGRPLLRHRHRRAGNVGDYGPAIDHDEVLAGDGVYLFSAHHVKEIIDKGLSRRTASTQFRGSI